MSEPATKVPNRIAGAAEAMLWTAALAFGLHLGWQQLEVDHEALRTTPPTAIEGLVEAEDLAVLGRSRDFRFWLQPTTSFSGTWSRDGQMLALQTERGDWIELELPLERPGLHRVELFLTRAHDYGIVRVYAAGAPLGDPIDLWSPEVEPTGPIDLGLAELQPESRSLRVEVIGTHPGASPPFYQFGIDGVRLTPP